MWFSQAYSGAPNCSPSRASLLTGRAPYRTGVYDFLSKQSGSMHLHRRERTIANLLRDAGYATAHYGKWHLNVYVGRNGTPVNFPPSAAYHTRPFTTPNITTKPTSKGF